jgi:3-isopropylmalate/(R)-2-methylmalate dehydratase small subunit
VIVSGRAVVIRGDNVDTDVLYPGAYLNVTDVDEMRRYLFEGLDPSLRDELGGDTILVVGRNFGAGSSREHVPQAMRASGVRALVGESFARIFYRNCINLGLPAFLSADAAAAAKTGSTVEIDTSGEITVDGTFFPTPPLPRFMLDLLERGGLEPWVRAQA